MSLKSTAQDLSDTNFIIVEQEGDDQAYDHDHEHSSNLHINTNPPQEFLMGEPLSELSVEESNEHNHDDHEGGLIVQDQEHPLEVVLEIEFDGVKDGKLPGAPNSEEPMMVVEPALDVEESSKKDEENAMDQNDAKKSKKSDRWDWESKGATGFIAWVKERFETVPKHSGYDTAGLERAVSYLEKLDSEISKAMRLDLEEELDANKVEEIRSKIENGIERLQDRLDKIKKTKKDSRKKKSSTDENPNSFIKEAQKITGVQGVYIMAPLFASRIARICINGTVSAGHDIEDLYSKQVKKWKLTDREQAEVMQLLSDMGYPLRQDRGYMPDDDVEISSSDNLDWAANYRG
jgi:hypothetical protein